MSPDILSHFQKNDPVLYRAAIGVGGISSIEDVPMDRYFARLCRDIVCQQLSEKAGDAIYSRFLSLFPDPVITPERVLAMPVEELRTSGISNAKARYVRNLAEAVRDGIVDLERLSTISDVEVITELTKVKGIGPWTAEMFLMFTLARPDVFSFGDLGLRKGIMKLYGFKREPSVRTMQRLIKSWVPYRTYAARVLWASLSQTG